MNIEWNWHLIGEIHLPANDGIKCPESWTSLVWECGSVKSSLPKQFQWNANTHRKSRQSRWLFGINLRPRTFHLKGWPTMWNDGRWQLAVLKWNSVADD
jgi:hypothetical protein